MYPKIYLAIDNCLFYKRWTKPNEWAEKASDLGIRYIETSADTELDPLYMGKEYLNNWVLNVKQAEDKYNVKVCNLYSGHGSYTTLGITHTEERVREHMICNWFFPMTEIAGKLGCGMGFFAHGFNHFILQKKELYDEYTEILIDGLARINRHAKEAGCGKLGIEQMYTPHQYPWRIKDTENLIQRVTDKSKRDFYFTEDVGHHHSKFVRPEKNDFAQNAKGVWLGTDRAFLLAERDGMDAWEEIKEDMENNPQLFSEKKDGDCYETLRRLGCYSPIIHIQQTDGRQSSHLPFTVEENKKGIIKGGKLLKELKKSFELPEEINMPKKANEIYLTLELFSGTASIMQNVMKEAKESVAYWRKFVPEDGIALDKLVDLLEDNA